MRIATLAYTAHTAHTPMDQESRSSVMCTWQRTIRNLVVAVVIFTKLVFSSITPLQVTPICLGDVLRYNCSVEDTSNTNTVLEVAVTLPGLMRSSQTYTNTKLLNRTVSLYFTPRVTVTLTALNTGSVPRYAEAVIEITIEQLNAPINGSLLECNFGQRRNSFEAIAQNPPVPLIPAGLQISNEKMNNQSVSVSLSILLNPMLVPIATAGTVESIRVLLQWVAPSPTGHGSVMSSTIFSKNRYNLTHYPLNVTLNYNVEYTATVVAINCAGESQPLILSGIVYFNCGVPRLPLNASRNYSRTTEGAIATFICDRYFLPTVKRSSMCLRSGVWYPPPESHTCIFDDRRTSLIDTTTGRLLAAITPVSGYAYGILLILGVLLAYVVGQRSRRVKPEVHSPIQESHKDEEINEVPEIEVEDHDVVAKFEEIFIEHTEDAGEEKEESVSYDTIESFYSMC